MSAAAGAGPGEGAERGGRPREGRGPGDATEARTRAREGSGPSRRAGAAAGPHRPVRSLGERLARFAELYGLGVLVVLGLALVHGGWLPPVAALSHLAPLALLPSVPLLLAALAVRRWRAAGASAVGCVALAAVAASSFVRPAPAPAAAGPPALRVLSCNLGHRLTTADDLERAVRDADADLVALQEVGPHHEPALARLADRWPHQAVLPDGLRGMGLLSRTPLRDVRVLRKRSAHPYQAAVLDVAGRPLAVVHAHPRAWISILARWAGEARDLEELTALAAASAPALLVGDLNVTDRSWAWSLVEDAGLHDAWREAGRGAGLTFPVFGRFHHVPCPPIVRIDYVLHTGELVATSARVAPDVGSDHLPLVCELAWR